jgi:hypothetical protein
MESLSGTDRDYALRRVGLISVSRVNGLGEDDVAERAGYRGAGHMRQELEEWDFPSWFIEGDAPRKPNKPLEASKPAKSKRRARGTGPVIELPPASNAMPLFREKLDALAQDNEDLRHRNEKLQGGLFHHFDVWTDSSYFRREELPEEQSEFLAETHNLDPNAEGFLDTKRSWGLGDGTPVPQAPLPALIAAYVLTGGDPEPLLRALHPGEPSAKELEQIRMCIEGKKNQNGAPRDGLKAVAQQLARMVRGGPVRQGRYSEDLSHLDIVVAYRISDDRKAGMSDTEVFEKLHHDPPFALTLREELTWDEYYRLRDLNLEGPSFQ